MLNVFRLWRVNKLQISVWINFGSLVAILKGNSTFIIVLSLFPFEYVNGQFN